MVNELSISQTGNEITVKKKSRLERFYNRLGYTRLGTFLFQFTLFIFALILFGYLLLGIPQEAVMYEAYKPYIDKVQDCIVAGSTPNVWCLGVGNQSGVFKVNLSA